MSFAKAGMGMGQSWSRSAAHSRLTPDDGTLEERTGIYALFTIQTHVPRLQWKHSRLGGVE